MKDTFKKLRIKLKKNELYRAVISRCAGEVEYYNYARSRACVIWVNTVCVGVHVYTLIIAIVEERAKI